jgi:hypothetical protein
MILSWACINSTTELKQKWRMHQVVSYEQEEDGHQESVGAPVLHSPYI